MNLIILGAPGAGKGTQGALLAERKGLRQISTGDLLRDAVRRGTALGRKAQSYMNAGELVPDAIILDLAREVIADTDQGFILDGFPRTIVQAEALDPMLAELERPLDGVVVLDVPDDVLVKRISGRRSCPECKAVFNVYFDPPAREGVCDHCGAQLTHRPDDEPETVRRRLEVYRAQTEPLIAYYERSGTPVHYVDGQRGVDAVADAIDDVLEPEPA
ncbi:MAG TPA: adenylate kinase [Longimicrobiales bacterium]|nr:adenylate kinase [Longimicrobiales bacterium]